MVMKKMIIPVEEVISTGTIDDIGTLGDVTYRMPKCHCRPATRK